MTEGLDVELKRDASLRGVTGSVGRPDAGSLAVAILDVDWRSAEMGDQVPADSDVARMAAYLAVNESGDELPPSPWPPVNVGKLDHYRVDSSYIVEAAKRLDS
jgi:hypothetical protein